MSVLEIFGYFGALCVGLIMGLTGSGGSVLSVPILAYLFNYDEKVATAYSLFIVGMTALLGSYGVVKEKRVNFKAVVYFGIPSIVGVLLVRNVILPMMPQHLFAIGSYEITRRMLIFGLFGMLMLLSVYTVLRKSRVNISEFESTHDLNLSPWALVGGFFLGIFVGLIGAGGGFLMVPALMAFAKMPIKTAVATSLIIVCMNTLIGFFLGDFFQMKVDWPFLLSFVVLSFAGIILGGYLSRFVNARKLKIGFAFFILAMAIFVFTMEFAITRA